MYFLTFCVSLIVFVFATFTRINISLVDELSKIDEYEKELKKKTLIASLLTVLSICIAILPIIDEKTFEETTIKEKSQYSSYERTEVVNVSKLYKLQCKYDTPSVWYIWILFISEGIYLFTCIGYPKKEKKERIKQITNNQFAEAIRIEKNRKEKETETEAIKFITENFGRPDKIIHTTPATPPNWDRTVFFVFDKGLMYYNDRVVHFSELISCEYVDDSTIETQLTGTKTTESSTNTGSMLGRAVVGGILAGGAGAIIGGATAKQTGETKIETNSVSVTKHNYIIVINTANVRNPLLKINCGDCQQAVLDIVATLNAAIAKHKN